MAKEDQYLNKIQNDIDEKLYELLIIHLIDVHKHVARSPQNKEKLIEILDKGINNLKKDLNHFNRLSYYRFILIICNKILAYDTKRNDLKKLKQEIIRDFTQSEDDLHEKIPLNEQITELRITYDVRYLKYLFKCFIEKEYWDKALYCLIAIKTLEPDTEDLELFYKIIMKFIKSPDFENIQFNNPKNENLALDSNVVISKIVYNVDDFYLKSEKTFDLEYLGNYNKFIITDSVKNEVRKYLDYKLIQIKRTIKQNNLSFDYKKIEETLNKRFDNILKKYYKLTNHDDNFEEDIKDFYKKHLDKLEKIMQSKLRNKKISEKLKKLASRESLMPEEGDIKLLSEAIA
ncbi:MAG: hypothetical protein ACMXX8_02680, partial [Candidatus Woesearchaeota archaeon]